MSSREYSAAWRAGNHEKVDAASRRYRAAHREKLQERARAHYAANREKINARNRARYAADPEKARAYARTWRAENVRSSRANERRNRTGFTQADWDVRFIAQDGLCAICRRAAATDSDHAHDTGQKRGLLCGPCNRGLGHFSDDPALLLAAAAYLHSYGAVDSAANSHAA